MQLWPERLGEVVRVPRIDLVKKVIVTLDQLLLLELRKIVKV